LDIFVIDTVLVCIGLGAGHRTENYTITFLGQLIGYDAFHAPNEESRKEVLDEGFGCLAGFAELIYSGIVRLSRSQRFTNGSLPRRYRPKFARIGPVK